MAQEPIFDESQLGLVVFEGLDTTQDDVSTKRTEKVVEKAVAKINKGIETDPDKIAAWQNLEDKIQTQIDQLDLLAAKIASSLSPFTALVKNAREMVVFDVITPRAPLTYTP
jgi:hypothetical protein